jgi:hypothetical protein
VRISDPTILKWFCKFVQGRVLKSVIKVSPAFFELSDDAAQNHFRFSVTKAVRFRDKIYLGIKCVFLVSPQLLFETFFSPMNAWRITLEIRAEMHVNFHVKCPLLSDFNQNWIT